MKESKKIQRLKPMKIHNYKTQQINKNRRVLKECL